MTLNFVEPVIIGGESVRSVKQLMVFAPLLSFHIFPQPSLRHCSNCSPSQRAFYPFLRSSSQAQNSTIARESVLCRLEHFPAPTGSRSHHVQLSQRCPRHPRRSQGPSSRKLRDRQWASPPKTRGELAQCYKQEV